MNEYGISPHLMQPSAGELDWMRYARCRYADPGLFFGPDGESRHDQREREKEAKAVCAGCPVRRKCLAYAVVTPIQWGVWGQAGEAERARIRRNYLRRQRQYEKRRVA